MLIEPVVFFSTCCSGRKTASSCRFWRVCWVSIASHIVSRPSSRSTTWCSHISTLLRRLGHVFPWLWWLRCVFSFYTPGWTHTGVCAFVFVLLSRRVFYYKSYSQRRTDKDSLLYCFRAVRIGGGKDRARSAGSASFLAGSTFKWYDYDWLLIWFHDSLLGLELIYYCCPSFYWAPYWQNKLSNMLSLSLSPHMNYQLSVGVMVRTI